MKKLIRTFCIIILSILIISPNYYTARGFSSNDIYLGGIPVGFSLYSRGVKVIGISDVITDKGVVSPAKEAGIKTGDVILSIDGKEINTSKDIELSLKNDQFKTINIIRNNENIIINVKPQKDVVGNIKLGVFVRDEIDGIGTVTFIYKNKIASLGHPVIDDNNNLLEITDGTLYNCSINGYIKGEKGKPGELKGLMLRDRQIGKVEKNTKFGVYCSTENVDYSRFNKIETSQAKIGDAYIYSTINGREPKKYSIKIVKNDNYFSEDRNYFIKITDKELLSSTGGIVQGMSGSPIIQDNKLVGAVTHVLINDPTRGYGVSIDNMLSEID